MPQHKFHLYRFRDDGVVIIKAAMMRSGCVGDKGLFKPEDWTTR